MAKDDETAKTDADPAKPAGEGEGEERKLSQTAQRALARREEKLKLVQEQIDDGSLTIRKMTDEERKKFPPRDPPPKKKR